MSTNWTTVTHKRPAKDKSKPTESKPIQVQPKPVAEPTPWYEPPTIILKKKTAPEKAKVEKVAGPNSKKDQNVSHYLRKVEATADGDEGKLAVKTYPDDFRKKLLKLRLDLKLNQKQFAQKLNLKESVIKGIEANTQGYDPILVQKLTNFMQKNLPTAD